MTIYTTVKEESPKRSYIFYRIAVKQKPTNDKKITIQTTDW